jgi:hypothetical protein
MGDEPTDPATTWSNILQVLIVIGAVVGGIVALVAVGSLLGRLLGKFLIVGVPIAMAAAVAMGRKK